MTLNDDKYFNYYIEKDKQKRNTYWIIFPYDFSIILRIRLYRHQEKVHINLIDTNAQIVGALKPRVENILCNLFYHCNIERQNLQLLTAN